MFRWVDAACPGFFPCGSLARSQISFQGGCLFLSYIYKQCYGPFSALFLVKYQFEIAQCLYFSQLISCPIFWSMPVSCSWRQLSSELVVAMVKEHQEKLHMREFWLSQKLTQNRCEVTQNTPISTLNWSKHLGKRFGNYSSICDLCPDIIWVFCLWLTQVTTGTQLHLMAWHHQSFSALPASPTVVIKFK